MKRGKEYKQTLNGRKILVVGLGKSGKAAARALNEAAAVVSVYDSSTADKLDTQFLQYMKNEQINAFLGKEPDDMSIYDMLVMSPGVPTDLDIVEEAREKSVEIIGEVELAYRLSDGSFVAITGTNGKTTTTCLVGSIFESSGWDSSIVGNIGNPVVDEVESAGADSWLVTEVSSFQLETVDEFRPKVAAILNLTPDHLNRHKTMEAYAAAKARITKNQKEDDYFIYNGDDPLVSEIAQNTKAKAIPFFMHKEPEIGAYVDDTSVIVKDEHGEKFIVCDTDDLMIIGDHNIENVLAAAAISFFAGIDISIISKAVRSFSGVEHRIEFCGNVDGVDYYNDSKGTNTDAAIIALKALKNDIILIAGGDGKEQNFDELAAMFKGSVKALVLLGRDASDIEEAALRHGFTNIYVCKDMPDSVRKATELAEAGDKVLLSPACASWDMYDNYEQRGRHFKNCVKELLR